MTNLSYDQISSSINPSFWSKLSNLKLNVYKLNESDQHIWGYFTVIGNKNCPMNVLEVDSTSFNSHYNSQNMYLPFHGKLLNKNTVEEFRESDKMELINTEGILLLQKIENGSILRDPSNLNFFIILSFADLKKYHYYYWFAFPVPKELRIEKICCFPVTDKFSNNQLKVMYNSYRDLDDAQKTYFLLTKNGDQIQIHTLESEMKNVTLENLDRFYFVFSNVAHDYTLVGCQLRNYVAFILNYCEWLQDRAVNFIALNLSRDGSEINCYQSILYQLKLPLQTSESYKTWVGWEKNERQKMGPRLANLRTTLDPLVIAENSIDLNLKLMKWNVLPSVDLEKIKNTKCLLLGSGTLGCSVARTLLAWGVRYISFVDNSTVSFSNPVRQSLFTYEDSVDIKPKSLAAAINLKKIFPGVNSEGFQLTVPMPGHSVGESMLEQTKEDVNKLLELVKNNDIIFLLTDSRESRWLPTLLANAEKKIVINAALGFDTYLVMRHGIQYEHGSQVKVSHPEGFKSISGADLGCYFCNDVTAPGNSMKSRTLDQQCTVTRPGISQIASALAVELAISLLQHKDGVFAPAFYSTSQGNNTQTPETENSILGLIPHSIRGFLSSFEQILPTTQKYRNCVGCSEMVLNEYKNNGMDFLLKVFNSSKYLEDVALLTEMFEQTNFCDVLEFSDDDIQ